MEPITGFSPAVDPSFMGALLVVFVIVALIGLAVYVYTAFALMTIARKTGTPGVWLAFIPLANLVLMWWISKTPGWSLAAVFTLTGLYVLALIAGGFLAVAPYLIGIAAIFILLAYVAIITWWYWRIAEERGYPGAVGLLMSPIFSVVPYLNLLTGWIPLVTIGIIAWRDP